MKILKKIIPIIILFLMCFFTIGCGGKKASDSTLSNSNTVVSQDINDKDNKKNDNGQSNAKEEKKVQQLDNKKLKGKEENPKSVPKTEKNKNNTSTNLSNGTNKNPVKSLKSVEKSKVDKQVSNENKNGKNTFTLIIAKELKGYTGKNSEILVKKQIHIEGNKSAMTYLRENSQIRDKGGFVYEINGIHNLYPIPVSKKTSEQKRLKIMGIDWFIYLNGKKTSTGANDVYPKAGEELLLDIHEWDRRELAKDAY